MDVDQATGIALTQARRNDLHVARQHDAIGPGFFHQTLDFGKGRSLVILVDRHVMERNAVPFHQRAHVIVVGDDAGNLAIQITGLPAMQQVHQAMGVLGDHQHDTLLGSGVMHAPLHAELFTDRCEALAELIGAQADGFGVDLIAHEETAGAKIRMLIGFGDPPALLGDESGNSGNNSDLIRAGHHQAIGVRHRKFNHCDSGNDVQPAKRRPARGIMTPPVSSPSAKVGYCS